MCGCECAWTAARTQRTWREGMGAEEMPGQDPARGSWRGCLSEGLIVGGSKRRSRENTQSRALVWRDGARE